MAKCKWSKVVESYNGWSLLYVPKYRNIPLTHHEVRNLVAVADWNENHGCPVFANWKEKLLKEYKLIRFAV